jgi:cyclomaltodextrinase
VRPPFPDTPEELSDLGAPVLALYQELVALRRRHPWLVRARTSVEQLDNRQLVYRSTGAGGEALLVALNLDDADLVAAAPGDWRVEAGPGVVQDGKLRVGGHGWAVLTPR